MNCLMDELFRELSKKEKKKIRILEFLKTCLFNRGGLVKPKNTKRLKRCFYICDEIAINYAGDVVCTNDFFAKHSFGNVKNEKLMDIWNKPKFKKLRRDLLFEKFTLDICKYCAK